MNCSETSRKRRWPWLLVAFIVALVAAEQGYRSNKRHQVQQQLDVLVKKGFPTDCRALGNWRGPVPDQENGALQFVEAAAELSIPKNAFDNINWSRTEKLDPMEQQELKELLTNNAPALELLHAGARLRQSRYPIDYSRGPGTLLPHLAKLKALGQLLKVEAAIQAADGHPELAAQSVLDSMALARSLDAEPILISQLVRIALQAINCSSLERVLSTAPMPDAQWQQLQAAFAEANKASHESFRGAFAGEVCLATYCFHASPHELAAVMNSENSTGFEDSQLAPVAFRAYAWSGLMDRDFAFYLRTMNRIIDAASAPFPASLSQSREVARQTDEGLRSDRLLVFSHMLLPSLQKSDDKEADIEGRLRAAEVALAVERFRNLHQGALPQELSQLVPSFLTAVPADPIDGEPLRYHKLDRGYVVYSIGTDGQDDGGQERNPSGGSGIQKWPKKSKHSASNANEAPDNPRPARRSNNANYDVTFIVER
jgi:hypothetical protein